jgi:hypothetical protein
VIALDASPAVVSGLLPGGNIQLNVVAMGDGAQDSNASGLEVTESGGLGLLQKCTPTDNILKWNDSNSFWECKPDAGLTSISSMAEIDLGASAWEDNNSDPPAAGFTGVAFRRATKDFDADADEDVSLEMEIASTYDSSVVPTLLVVWSSAQVALDACWCLEVATVADDGDNTPSPTTAVCTSTTVSSSSGNRNETLLTLASGTDLVAGQAGLFHLFRDANESEAACDAGDDDMAGDAKLHGARLSYQVTFTP